MTSTNPEPSDNNDVRKTSEKPSEISPKETQSRSATTFDEPSFGWSAYAERVNGRFAMIGFTAVLLIEAISHTSFLNWAGLVP